jgi:NAD(P)-dependent dehydrogenase (short-subunit alcohol dehydrogenase family)
VVFVASTEGLRGSPMVAGYAASKHGLIGLARSAALTLAGEGIRVNAVCAGAMDDANDGERNGRCRRWREAGNDCRHSAGLHLAS